MFSITDPCAVSRGKDVTIFGFTPTPQHKHHRAVFSAYLGGVTLRNLELRTMADGSRRVSFPNTPVVDGPTKLWLPVIILEPSLKQRFDELVFRALDAHLAGGVA